MIAEMIASGALVALLDSVASLLAIIYGGVALLILALTLAIRMATVPLVEAVQRARRGASE